MGPSSFHQGYYQILNWLHRPSRHWQRRPGCLDRPLALEPLEDRMLLTGTWTPLAQAAPEAIGTMLLLSDGTVMAQGAGGNMVTKTWYQLTPDASGSYVDGTWSPLASMSLERLYYGSAVLPDGRVFLVGGEYSGPLGISNDTNTGEIYDPLTNSWTPIANFPQSRFGDDPVTMLPDGRVLGGYLLGPETYIYDPATNSWTAAGTKLRNDKTDEESWVKLPDDSILSYDVWSSISMGAGHAQRYIPSTGQWVDAGTVPVLLTDSSSGDELGPAFRLPDGRVWFTGANGHTAFYTPSTDTWAAGPDLPTIGGKQLSAYDEPGAVLSNGKVLLSVGTLPVYGKPTYLLEFDPATNDYTDVTPTADIINTSGAAYNDRMLMLPTGQVLLTTGFNQLAVYTPDGTPDVSWAPTISSITANGDGSYTLAGTQLNGINEGAVYGDDAQMSTNYPIVRISDTSGNVYYARTYNWSSTGVATGSTPVTTQFTVPAGLNGTYNVEVIANGIASSLFSYSFGVTQFSVTPSVNTVVAGTPLTITVTALDANQNVVPGYQGTVTFSSSDSQAGLPADYTFTAADHGVHSFPVTLATASDQTLTATDTINNSITGSATVTVTPAAASQFVVVTDAADPDVAGTPFDVTVIAQDLYGNTDTNYQGTVTFSSGDPYGATLPADDAFQASDQGQVTFYGVTALYTAGTWDVTATDTISGIAGSAFVNVQAAPAVALQVNAPPTATSGQAFDVTVVAVDPYGNTDTNYGGTVTWTTTDPDPGVVLPPDHAFQPSDRGMVTFPGGVTLITPGDQTLFATDTVSGITGSTIVTVTAGPMVGLVNHLGSVVPVVAPGTSSQAPASTGASVRTATDGVPSSQEHERVDRFFMVAREGRKQDAVLDFVLNPIHGSLEQGTLATDLVWA
jgi:hypothetical protein